jgi:CheY-like chemotaxis protein
VLFDVFPDMMEGPIERREAMRAGRPAAPVLVVEDNAELRHVLIVLLESDGYAVVEAGNGLEALRLLRSAEVLPCLIVLDMGMPRMNGWDFRAEQDCDERLRSIPVVVVSADPLATQARHTGAAVLLKPIDPEKLLELVERHCAR